MEGVRSVYREKVDLCDSRLDDGAVRRGVADVDVVDAIALRTEPHKARAGHSEPRR